MSTTKKQRINIWVITILLVLGTVVSFIALILNEQSSVKEQAQLQKEYSNYEKAYKEYQTEVDTQNKQLSSQYYSTLNQFASSVGNFDAKAVTKLSAEDLIVGTGDTITSSTVYSAYYIGWNPKGKIFDQSISKGALKSPVSSDSGLIKGWTQGAVGMKLGGVRELSVPSDLAYGKSGKGTDIPANTPLKFIILAIPKIDTISQPSLSEYITSY
jgi:FKBP-type peptidyl-prolyl cis-trans isomerase FkpA